MAKKYFNSILSICIILLFATCGGDNGMVIEEKGNTPTDQDEDRTTATIDEDYIYKLPVIFHVLYTDKSKDKEYVDAVRLKTILAHVNELYKGNIYGKSQNIKVQFVLAERDENGKALNTPGVEYVHWKKEYPISANDFMNDDTRTNVQYIWDPNEYINVMVYNFKETNTKGIVLGVSHMPYSIQGNNSLEGLANVSVSHISKSQLKYPHCISLNSIYIYKESSRYTIDKGKNSYQYVNDDVNVTLAHELGHYLGAFHPFTEKDNEPADQCEDTDYCRDTPSYNKIEYDNYVTYYLSNARQSGKIDFSKLVERNSCSNGSFKSYNIMDYSVSLSYELTADQKQRMRHVLYYSPLIPGPKRNGANIPRAIKTKSRSHTNEIPLDLPVRVVE